MSNLFEKAKEKIQENIVQAFIGAISGLVIVIAGYFGPFVIPIFVSIPNNILLASLALSVLINIGLLFYLSHLSQTQMENFIKRFGVLWDKDHQPHCPACKNLLSGYEETLGGTLKTKRGRFTCINCNRPVEMSTDHGSFISFSQAKEQLKEERAQV